MQPSKKTFRRIILVLSALIASLGAILLILRVFSTTAGIPVPQLAWANEASIGIPQPILTPTMGISATCQNTYWYTLTTPLGTTAYLTLNTREAQYATNAGEWRPTITQSGYYSVEAYIPDHAPITWCTPPFRTIVTDTADAHYEIVHAGGITTVIGNQRAAAGGWLSLGVHPFDAGTQGAVFLADLNNEESFTYTVSFSAMRFTYLRPLTKTYLPVAINNDGETILSPIVQVVQRQGFDKCTIPTLSQMQTWWNESPYYIFNLYLGGVSFASGCKTASPSWVASVRAQGWAFIPTWVGLQAPCSKYSESKRMSYDPAVAYQQGRSEAEAAANAAATMGLTFDGLGGSVIYHDLEAYGGSAVSPSCREAVKAFINGWVERHHELGNKAGVYGGGCSSNATDWATIPHIPDDVWLASWYTSSYDPNATVWNVGCVTNSLWPNHQRLRQYAGSHSETWGSVRFEIDSNISDGEVISFSTPNLASSPQVSQAKASLRAITAHQLVAAAQGWVLVERQLLWTSDDGLSWKDITPSAGKLLSAFFLDPQTGWAVTAGKPGFQVWSTSNGGGQWAASTIEGLPDDAPWYPTSIQFVSPKSGWIAFRQATSVHFSIGVLFRTNDGGHTWQMIGLPVAGEIHFSDTLTGWLTGGVTGDETFVTADGGQTWQPAGQRLLPDEQLLRAPEGMLTISRTAGEAWALTSEGQCQAFKQDCAPITTLWKSSDNGGTWLPVNLP